jgi:hypothetical protein
MSKKKPESMLATLWLVYEQCYSWNQSGADRRGLALRLGLSMRGYTSIDVANTPCLRCITLARICLKSTK